jgi:O-antigen ligase
MTTFGRSLRSAIISGLDILIEFRFPLIGLVAVGLGVSFSYLIDSSGGAWLLISIIAVVAVLFIVISNPLHGVLVWLFFMVFFESWVEIPMGAGIPDLSFSRFTIAFLSISLLAKAAIGKFRFARIGLAEVCILATPIGIMMAALQSIDPNPKGVIQVSIAMHFTPLVMYFFAKNLVQNRNDLHKVFWAIALLGFVSGTCAVYEYATGNILFVAKDRYIGALYRETLNIRIIRGVMGSTGNMGRALAACIPVTFYLFLERKKNDIGRILLIVMLIAQFYGIYVAMARAPWYALLLGLFIMQFFYPRFRRLFYVIVFVAAIVLWATWDQVSEGDAADRVNDKASTLEGREVRWQAGYNMWRVKPIRGWGFGRYKEESGRFRTDGESRNCSAIENDYLYILVGSGLIGFLPYLTFLLAPLVNSLRLFFKARALDWSGFIKPETLTVYWAVILCLAITSYSAIQTQVVIKLMTFAVVGAVVGTHEHLLCDPEPKRCPLLNLSPQ